MGFTYVSIGRPVVAEAAIPATVEKTPAEATARAEESP